MAEMAAKAHEISLEAGSKMASAMRDVIGAAAGISAFAIESARDLVNYMVRRGQMTQEEATKLLREVEEAHNLHPKELLPPRKIEVVEKVEVKPPKPAAPVVEKPAPVVEKAAKPAPKPAKVVARAPAKPAPKAAAKQVAKGKPAAKGHSRPPAKKAPAKKK
jgi:polyhydroxyalkanoate synthesis regulator phasin